MALVLQVCADTLVGDQMRRGISGGQKKRVTTGLHFSCLPFASRLVTNVALVPRICKFVLGLYIRVKQNRASMNTDMTALTKQSDPLQPI